MLPLLSVMSFRGIPSTGWVQIKKKKKKLSHFHHFHFNTALGVLQALLKVHQLPLLFPLFFSPSQTYP